MQRQTGGHPGPWPAGPGIRGPVLVSQRWSDAVFLHWRIPPSMAEPYLPPGVQPDIFLGSAWVGLIGFRLHRTRLAGRIPLPWLGSFTEINVRLYTRGADGSTGVLFVTLDASRLPAVLAARAAGIPYIWSRCRPVNTGGMYGYEVRRFGKQAASRFTVIPDFDAAARDDLALEVTARFGAHAAILGRTVYVPNTHQQWPLYQAELQEFDTELPAAAGFPVSGPPDSVLFSPGVQTAFGRPWQVPRQAPCTGAG